MLYFLRYVKYKCFKQQKWPSRSLKVTGNGAIQLPSCDFLLVFHCNYVSILHRFRVIVTYFPKFKKVLYPWTHPFPTKTIVRALVHLCVSQHTTFEVPSFTNFNDMIGAKKFLTGYVTLTMPLLGVVCHP